MENPPVPPIPEPLNPFPHQSAKHLEQRVLELEKMVKELSTRLAILEGHDEIPTGFYNSHPNPYPKPLMFPKIDGKLNFIYNGPL